MKTLTAANSVLLISVTGLFDIPVRLQGFSADNVYDTDDVTPTESSMGVDGKLSAGWVPVAVRQGYSLQADSDSIEIFERWYQAQQSAREVYYAQGSSYLPSVDRKYTMRKGVLQSYSVLPPAQKTLQPRKFSILWESVSGAAI